MLLIILKSLAKCFLINTLNTSDETAKHWIPKLERDMEESELVKISK